jgi:hypothetical protein
MEKKAPALWIRRVQLLMLRELQTRLELINHLLEFCLHPPPTGSTVSFAETTAYAFGLKAGFQPTKPGRL